jgi:phage regulator Rha-like protein
MNDISFGNFRFVVAVDGEPLTSTEVISQEMGQKHRAVMQLVRKHSGSLGELGGVQFQIAPFVTNGGTQSREIAMLNEHQAALLLSLMRNSKKVIDFKVALVKEFFRMRDTLNHRNSNLWQQMQALIAKEVESKVRASFGSHLMLQRKKEIPPLQHERIRLEAEIQPSLLLH